MNTPTTILTLPVEPQDLRVRWGSVAERSEDRLDASDEAYTALLPEDRFAAARFDDLLTLADTAESRGYDDLADAYLERIVAELVACPDGLNGPGGHAA